MLSPLLLHLISRSAILLGRDQQHRLNKEPKQDLTQELKQQLMQEENMDLKQVEKHKDKQDPPPLPPSFSTKLQAINLATRL